MTMTQPPYQPPYQPAQPLPQAPLPPQPQPPQQAPHQQVHPGTHSPHQPFDGQAQPAQQLQGPPYQAAPAHQQWVGQYPQHQPTAAPPGPGVTTHLRRAIDWNVAEVRVSPREQAALQAAGVEPRLHGLFAWRRSTLLVAMPILLVSVVLSLIEAADLDSEGFNAFGKVWLFLPTIGLVFVPIGVMRVIAGWTEMWGTAKFLIACWLLSLAFPLFAALIPLDMVIDIDGARRELQMQGGDLVTYDATVTLARLLQAISFALILLPVVLSVPGGVLKGASRIKSLFPSSSLPGWFLVAVAPFYSLFTVVVFVLIVQIVGNGLLLAAVAILAFTPWLFVIYRKVYGRPLSVAEARTELARASRLGGWLMLCALSLIVVFALTAEVSNVRVLGSGDDAVFSYVQVLRTVGEVLSRGLVTTVVFSSIFLGMVFSEWRETSSLTGDVKREHDEQMAALQHFFQRQPGA
jgi:hypothetical protein